MRKTIIASALIAASVILPTMAHAEEAAPAPEHTFTSNIGFASEYVYRGIGQTNQRHGERPRLLRCQLRVAERAAIEQHQRRVASGARQAHGERCVHAPAPCATRREGRPRRWR